MSSGGNNELSLEHVGINVEDLSKSLEICQKIRKKNVECRTSYMERRDRFGSC